MWITKRLDEKKILNAGGGRKGKWAPLAVLTPRLGASRLLALQPNLLSVTLGAMAQYDVCSSASALWAALLARLRTECHAEAGVKPL